MSSNSNKFFKHKRRVALMNIDKHLMARLPDGKITMLEVEASTSKRRRIEREIQKDAANFALSDFEQFVVPDKINNIIESLEEKENPRLLLKASSSHVLSDESILLHNTLQRGKDTMMSPTSQMCNMASGLVLNSPKRARQDLNSILKDMPDATNSANGKFLVRGYDVKRGCSTPLHTQTLKFTSSFQLAIGFELRNE